MGYLLKPLEIFVLSAPVYNGTYLVPFGILTRSIVQVYYWYLPVNAVENWLMIWAIS